jgi:hypothetical protein
MGHQRSRRDARCKAPLTSFRPVVSRTALAENKVVGSEEAPERTGADRVHSAGLEIDEHGTGHVLVRADLVVVHGDSLELEVVCALVLTVPLNAMLIRDDLPKFGT